MGLFDFAPYVGPALGILGGLFGGGHKTNPQVGADLNTSRGFLDRQQGVATQIGNQASRYGTLADYAAGNYASDDPAMRTATQNEIDYLGEDPNTNQSDAAYLASATRGSADGFDRGNARLTSSLTARGFTGDSSNLAGGLTSLAETQAGQAAGAQNALAQRKIAQADANRRSIIGLTTGLASNDYAHETAALGSQTGALDSEAGQYGNLGSQYRSLAEYEQGRQNSRDAQDAQFWGGIGSGIGQAADGSGRRAAGRLSDAEDAFYTGDGLGDGVSPVPSGTVPLSSYVRDANGNYRLTTAPKLRRTF